MSQFLAFYIKSSSFFTVLFTGILLLIITVSVCNAENFQLFFNNEKESNIYRLEVPERWFKKKTKKFLSTSYVKAEGIFQVKKSKDGKGLLFRKGNSANIYFWKYGSEDLKEKSAKTWSQADNIESLYTNNKLSKILIEEDKIEIFLNQKEIQTKGNSVLQVRQHDIYYDVISFSGEIKESKKGILMYGGGNKYTGKAYIEIFRTDLKSPLVGISQKLNKSGFSPFSESFWIEDTILIIPDNQIKNIFLIGFKN